MKNARLTVLANIVNFDAVPCKNGAGYEIDAFGDNCTAAFVPVMMPAEIPAQCWLDPLAGFGTGFIQKTKTHVIVGQIAAQATPVTTWQATRQLALVVDRDQWDVAPEGCLQAVMDWLKKTMARSGMAAPKSDRVKLSVVQRGGAALQQDRLPQYQFGDIGVRRCKGLFADFAAECCEEGLAVWGMNGCFFPSTLSISCGKSRPMPAPNDTANFEANFTALLTQGMADAAPGTLSCGEALFQNQMPGVVHLFPAQAALASAVKAASVKVAGQAGIMFAPSTLRAILDYPALARSLCQAAACDDGYWQTPLRCGLIALALLDGPQVVVPKLMRYFQAPFAGTTPWADWVHDPVQLREVLRGLASDRAVADIETHWGDGSALALGQMITATVRETVAPSFAPLTPATRVSGHA